jgi:hypothetical protein
VFQVIFAFAPGVAGAVWSNNTIIHTVGAGCELLHVFVKHIHASYPGSPALPFYRASNIISSCSIVRQPTGSIPQQSRFISSPFIIQVSNRPELPYRYVIASARIIVRQNGVVIGGASAVVDPFSGSASLGKFKLIRSLGMSSVTYDIVSNGVLCSRALSRKAFSIVAGNSIQISAIPAVALISPDYLSSEPVRRVKVGLESISIDYVVLDANEAELLGVSVQIQVWFCFALLLFSRLNVSNPLIGAIEIFLFFLFC